MVGVGWPELSRTCKFVALGKRCSILLSYRAVAGPYDALRGLGQEVVRGSGLGLAVIELRKASPYKHCSACNRRSL